MTPEGHIQRIDRSVRQLVQEIELLPAEVLYREPGPGEWPVMSTLAHLAEFLPYWAHQAREIAASPGMPFGRTHADPDRIGAVEQHGRDALDTMVPRIRAGLDECVNVLRALPADAWTKTGEHPSRGALTVEQLVDSFLVSHAEEHAHQTQATLQALGSANRSSA